MKMKTITLAIVSAVFFSACVMSDNTSGSALEKAKVRLEMKLAETATLAKVSANGTSSLSLVDASGTVFNIESAQANIRHIEFDLPDSSHEESEEDKISVAGPFVVDLMTGSFSPNLSDVEIPVGTYKRMDIRLDDAEMEDGLLEESHGLLEHSLVVTGSFSYDGVDNRKFSIKFQFNEDIRFETEAGIEVTEGTLNTMAVHLLVNEWLEGADITGCLQDGDMELDSEGNLHINDSNASGKCAEIEGIIKDNMKNNYDLK